MPVHYLRILLVYLNRIYQRISAKVAHIHTTFAILCAPAPVSACVFCIKAVLGRSCTIPRRVVTFVLPSSFPSRYHVNLLGCAFPEKANYPSDPRLRSLAVCNSYVIMLRH
jgi:hypothetical protein